MGKEAIKPNQFDIFYDTGSLVMVCQTLEAQNANKNCPQGKKCDMCLFFRSDHLFFTFRMDFKLTGLSAKPLTQVQNCEFLVILVLLLLNVGGQPLSSKFILKVKSQKARPKEHVHITPWMVFVGILGFQSITNHNGRPCTSS